NVGHSHMAIAIEEGQLLKIASVMGTLQYMLGRQPYETSFASAAIQKPPPVTPAQAAQITEEVSSLLFGRFPSMEDSEIKDLVSQSVQKLINKSDIDDLIGLQRTDKY